MSETAGSQSAAAEHCAHQARAKEARTTIERCARKIERYAPRRWIYQNLTPWRIQACFGNAGLLARQHHDGADGRGPGGATQAQSIPSVGGVAVPFGTNGDSTGQRDDGGVRGAVTQVLSIPALGQVTVPREDASRLDTLEMRRLGQIEVRPAPTEFWSHLPRAIVIFGWIAAMLFYGGWALFFGGLSALPLPDIVAVFVAVPVAALVVSTVREIHLYRRFSNYRRALEDMRKARRALQKAMHALGESQPASEASSPESGLDGWQSLEGVEQGSRVRTFVNAVPRQAAEVAVLIVAIVVSVIGLGVAIHLTSQLNDLLPIDYGALLRLDNPFRDVNELARNSPAFWQLLVGHVAQWILVSVAALAPAAMYFQFDRQRLAAIRWRWIHEVFRLDPTVRTVSDIEAKYGSRMEPSFGDLGSDSGLRLTSGRRSPVIVATILLALGWFLIISATRVPDLIELPIGEVATETGDDTQLVWPQTGSGDAGGREGTATAEDGGPFPASTFFRPTLSLVGYAFLGAYVFTLLHVIRGYQRRDLHPKTYNTVVVRVLVAYALALVIGVVAGGPRAQVLLFFVGFTPQSALVWLKEKLSKGSGAWRLVPLQEPAPLTDIEGIDLYDRTRLAEEGINNIEALAHADIVELMSSTRIAAAQLVDWTDQAILYLRVGGDARVRYTQARSEDDRRTPGSTGEPGEPPNVHRNLSHLRTYGIRTATDLLQAYEQALRRGRERARRDKRMAHVVPRADEYQAAEVEALRTALDLPDAPHEGGVRTIQTIIDTLPDEEWFMQVRNWRTPEFGAVDAWYWYLDGTGWQVKCANLPARVQKAGKPFKSIPMANHPTPGEGARRPPAHSNSAR
jgi:hypothetical protein